VFVGLLRFPRGINSTATATSQNHRMVGVGRDLCGSSSPTPLPSQGHLQQAAQDLVQAGLEYLQQFSVLFEEGQQCNCEGVEDGTGILGHCIVVSAEEISEPKN